MNNPIRLTVFISFTIFMAGCNKPENASKSDDAETLIERSDKLLNRPVAEETKHSHRDKPALTLEAESEEEAKMLLDDYCMRPWEYSGKEAKIISLLDQHITDPTQRRMVIEALTIPFFENDPDAFLEWVKGGKLKSQDVLLLGTILEAHDSDEISENMLKISALLPLGRQGNALATEIVGNYAKHDLEGSLRFAQENFSPSVVSDMIREIYAGLEPEQFDAAVDSLKSIENDPDLLKSAITSLSTAASSVNVMTSYDWVLAGYGDNPELFDGALLTTLLTMSHAAPESYFSSLERVENHDKRGDILASSIPTLMSSMESQEVVAIIEKNYASLLPEVAGTLVDSWVDVSSVDASRWIFSLPSGEARDNAVFAFIRHAAEFDSGDSTLWLDLIQSSEIRQNAASHIGALSGE